MGRYLQVAPLVLEVHCRAFFNGAQAQLFYVGPFPSTAALHAQHQGFRLFDGPAKQDNIESTLGTDDTFPASRLRHLLKARDSEVRTGEWKDLRTSSTKESQVP